MKLRIGRRVFAPSWVGILLTALVVPGMISLGVWQLGRAEEKRDLTAQAAQGREQVMQLSAGSKLPRYQRVQVTGHYDSARQVLLDNMPSSEPTSRGQPGYRVWTPLLLSDQSIVLVDRGWLPLKNRAQLPDINVNAEMHMVTGMIDELPRPGVRAGNAGITDQWPQVLNFPNFQELQSLYGSKLQPQLVLLDADASDGYERIWQIDLGFAPERHVGYAIQWFGMALTVCIIFLVVNLKRIEHE